MIRAAATKQKGGPPGGPTVSETGFHLVPVLALPFADAGLIATLTPAAAPVLILVIPSVIAPGFAPGLGFLAALLLIALGHGGFAGEFHAAFLVHAEAFDPDFIAHLNNVFSRLAE